MVAQEGVPEPELDSRGIRRPEPGPLRLSPTTAVGPTGAELEPHGLARPVLVAAPAPRKRVHQEHPPAALRDAGAPHPRSTAAGVGDLAAQDAVRGPEREPERARGVQHRVGDQLADEQFRHVEEVDGVVGQVLPAGQASLLQLSAYLRSGRAGGSGARVILDAQMACPQPGLEV